ncbi:hypothetical protein [Streptomyces canus]|uniref:hypothetical protein n=1 Tax=Streptomyces canus TaxID=58343 RepID=UPI002E2DF6EE|nr:hypothetical protein [Streptomyces canus]
MPDILFRQIHCTETTSGAGADDCAIYFKGERVFRQQMKGGRTRDILNVDHVNVIRHFEGTEIIHTKEIDEGSDDDIIGEVEVNGANMGNFTAIMVGDGSRYELTYSVGGSP